MPLYIKDPIVSEMAEQFRRLTNAPSKTEALRRALAQAIGDARSGAPIEVKIERALSLAEAIGPANPGLADKRFFDEMWGE